jgi:hypothetical protein
MIDLLKNASYNVQQYRLTIRHAAHLGAKSTVASRESQAFFEKNCEQDAVAELAIDE